MFSSHHKGNALFYLFTLLTTLLVLSLPSNSALASPIENKAAALIFAREKNIPDKEEVEKLIKPENIDDFGKYAHKGTPHKDKAIFFTGQNPQTINKIVSWATHHHRGLTSVRNIWKSPNFFNRKQYKEVSDEDFKKFQQAFSRYYAQQTSGKAYLIFPHDKKPAKTGIFWSIELEELIELGHVDEIIWLDQNKIGDEHYDWKGEKTIYWKKGEPKPDGA